MSLFRLISIEFRSSPPESQFRRRYLSRFTLKMAKSQSMYFYALAIILLESKSDRIFFEEFQKCVKQLFLAPLTCLHRIPEICVYAKVVQFSSDSGLIFTCSIINIHTPDTACITVNLRNILDFWHLSTFYKVGLFSGLGNATQFCATGGISPA